MGEKRAIIIADMSGGGSQRVAGQLARDWLEAGHDLVLVTLSSPDTDVVPMPAAVRRISLGATGASSNVLSGFLSNMRRVLAIRHAIRETRPDLIVSFLAATNVLSILACKGLNVRLVISERNDPARQPLGRIWEFLRRRLYRRADCVTANSRQALKTLASFVPESKLLYVPNPLPEWPDASPAPRGRERIVLAVGRLHRQKAYDLMLAVFAASKAKALGWRLAILGEGDERAKLEALAQNLEIADALEMHGHCDSVRECYDRAGLFMMTSRYEGMPNAMIEAISRGLPVLVSDTCGDATELVRKTNCGFVVDPEQTEASAKALDRLLEDRNLRHRLSGNGAKAMAQEFSAERVMCSWEAAVSKGRSADAA